MVTEAIRLHTRDHRVVEGQADVVRRGRAGRLARALLLAVAGLLLGAAFIVVPILHLFTTWIFPMLGIGLGVWVYRIAIVVKEVRATCPDCGEAMRVRVGALEEYHWIRCPSCATPLRLEVGEAPRPLQGK